MSNMRLSESLNIYLYIWFQDWTQGFTHAKCVPSTSGFVANVVHIWECCASYVVLSFYCCCCCCFNGGKGKRSKKKLFKTFQPLVSRWVLKVFSWVEHSDLIDQDGSTGAGVGKKPELVEPWSQGYRLWSLTDLDRVCTCYRVSSTCSTFLVDKVGITKWPYRVVRI